MRFLIIDPEVAGGWGPNTKFTRIPGKPLVVHKLHYQFDGWLGDELLESSPCFIVTDRLRSMIEASPFSGYEIDSVEITTSEQFREMYPDRELPKFWWLKIVGKAGVDDFGLNSGLRLVVSDRVLSVLKAQCQMDHCETAEFA